MAIYLAYLSNNLHNVFLQVKTFKEANCAHFKKLYKIFYKESHSVIIIPINAILGRCFFVSSSQIPKHNNLEVMAAVELWGL